MSGRRARGLSWDEKGGKPAALLALSGLVAALFVPVSAASSEAPALSSVDVIVREVAPDSSTAESLVQRLGGTVGDHLAIIGGFTASVPVGAIAALESSAAIATATPDSSVWLTSTAWEDSSVLSAVDYRDYPGSMHAITEATHATTAWSNGATGAGIDVAVIDTGVVPVEGLSTVGKVFNGADLSFESQNERFRYLDSYGHGTHMAGIIAGRDASVGAKLSAVSEDSFVGMAPDARIVNVKVGSYDGAVDVSQVIAAIDWVVQHRTDRGMNIRVLNLSFGTDSTQSYMLDPLAVAVEKAWKAGIVVVAAAGNDGNPSPLRNPAYDPFVIAVGSAQAGTSNTSATRSLSTFDALSSTSRAASPSSIYDQISTFSNCGTAVRGVDLVAPGKSVTSLRTPGSYADDNHPEARVGDRFFVGSGTSQAAAVVSGAVAQVLSVDRTLSPNDVKYLLTSNAVPVAGAVPLCQGAGVVDLGFLSKRLPRPKATTQPHVLAVGNGSLEASRGTDHVAMDGIELRGEQDIMGNPWIGFNVVVTQCSNALSSQSGSECIDTLVPTETLWKGGDWNGATWTGTSWTGTSWTGTSWTGTSWTGTSWTGTSWTDKYWSGTSWTGTSWTGTSWTGTSWTGTSWTGQSWG